MNERRKIALEYRFARSFYRLDKRSCREWLGQVGDASRVYRGRAVRITVIAGDKDDWQIDIFIQELATQIYPRLIVQIDVKDNAKCIAEIGAPEQRGTGIEQCCVEAVLYQQPFHAHAY
jgi:hypothetical protein